MWCIPPEQNADFVAKTEDVSDVYSLPYNENCPVICIDEKPYQLLDERRDPLPMSAGKPKRIPNIDKLNHEIAVWEETYNAKHNIVDWQFSTENARIKLKRLYPVF